MKILAAWAAVVAGAALCLAQQKEILAGEERPATILERLEQSPLGLEQKEQVRRALEARDYRGAETILVKAVEANPKSAGVLTLTARVFFLDKNPANTAIALKKAEKLRPLDDSERFLLAMAYLGIGRGAWARPELEKLVTHAANPLYVYWLSRIDYDERKYQAAVDGLRIVTRQSPDFARAWDNLGLSLEGLGQLDDAVASYRQAVRLNREQKLNSPWPPLNLATLLSKVGELKEAEELIREALRYQETLAEAHYRLGVNLRKQNRPADAIIELRRALELDSEATGPLYALGQLYREQGDKASAVLMFDRLRELKKKKRGI